MSDSVRCMHTTSPPEWDAPTFARTIKVLKDSGLTATDLATLAGVSRPQVSRWSSGAHRPGYDPLKRLSEALISQRPDLRDAVATLVTAAGYPGIAADLGITDPAPPASEEMVSPYSGEVWRIVRSLTKRAEDAGLTEEEEREAIEAVMRRAEEAMERDLDAELYRRERGSADG